MTSRSRLHAILDRSFALLPLIVWVLLVLAPFLAERARAHGRPSHLPASLALWR